ncbi:MAG: recombinase family protein [Thermomicrobiales bacterium]
MVGRVSKGFPMVASRPPYGWMYVPGDRCGQLLHDPDEAPVVQRIFAWIAHDGLTLFEVARRLTVEGVPTRADRDGSIIHKAAGYGHWDHRALASMVRAEVHKGLWHWGKTKQVKHGDGPARRVPRPREEWVAVQVEPLVDVATWERAQERIVANRTNAKRNAKRDYLLRSLIFCPCGRRWVGHSRSPVDPHPSYRCASWQSPNAACAHRFMIRQATLERAVLDALKAFLSDPDVRGASLLAERDRVATARDTANEELATVDRELGKVERQLSRLLDQSLDGLFPTEQIATKSRALTAERARLLAKRERELAALAAPVLDIDGAIAELAPMVEAAFTTATPADLRHLLELLRIEVHIIDRETVRLTGLVGDIETHLSRVTNSHSKA